MDYDAFSSGQVLSKLWLAEKLENVVIYNHLPQPRKILCLGGWYGMTNFILRTRNNIKIEKFRNIDKDQKSCEIADKINNLWEWQQWQFKSIQEDANSFEYDHNDFDTVINTSVEHISNKQWFDKIPEGTLVVLQSNNMKHNDHCYNHNSVLELIDDFFLREILYQGQKYFEYPDWDFYRFMIIGIK
jgi:hypothetical protein